jgi:hypothetical protein
VGDTVGNYLNSEALCVTDRLLAGLAVANYARQFEGLRDPAPILLAIKVRSSHSLFDNTALDKRRRVYLQARTVRLLSTAQGWIRERDRCAKLSSGAFYCSTTSRASPDALEQP